MLVFCEKDEINVPVALSAFRDGDQGPSKVTKVFCGGLSYHPHPGFLWGRSLSYNSNVGFCGQFVLPP